MLHTAVGRPTVSAQIQTLTITDQLLNHCYVTTIVLLRNFHTNYCNIFKRVKTQFWHFCFFCPVLTDIDWLTFLHNSDIEITQVQHQSYVLVPAQFSHLSLRNPDNSYYHLTRCVNDTLTMTLSNILTSVVAQFWLASLHNTIISYYTVINLS